MNYYVSNLGNDLNDGLSELTSWLTLAKVRATTFVGGDHILLKSGDVWSESFGLAGNGLLNNRIVISSYGGTTKPEVRGYSNFPASTIIENWSLYSTGIYRITQATTFKRLWVNGVEQHEAKSIPLIDDYFNWRCEAGFLYIKAPSNPATFFNSIAWGRSQYNTADFVDKSNLSISEIKFTGGANSIRIENGKNISIENCVIGYRTNNYGMWIVSTNNDTTENIVISNNKLDANNSLFYSYYRSNHATDDAIYLSSGAINCKINNNYFEGWNHCGVSLSAIDPSYPFHDNEVYNNFITAPILDYSRGLGISYSSNGYNVSVHHNTVYDTSVRSQINGNNLKFHDNIIDKVRGCPYPEKANVGHGLSIEGYASDATNMEIYNNTISNCYNAGLLITWTGSAFQKAYNNMHDNNIFNNDVVNGYQVWISTNDPAQSINHNTYTNNHLYKSGVTNLIYNQSGVKNIETFNGSTPCLGDMVSGNTNSIVFPVSGVGNRTVSLNEFRILHNETGSNKTVKLAYSAVALDGTKYTTSATIPPYSSNILVKSLAKYQTIGGVRMKYNGKWLKF